MNEIILAGCTPAPLANYLKALGVLRLLAEQDAGFSCKGLWRDGTFVLQSPQFTGQIDHDRNLLGQFFLDKYQPSALVTPWNGRGGFLEGDDDGEESSRAGAQMVKLFTSDATTERFMNLSNALRAIASIESVGALNSSRSKLKQLKTNEKAKGKKSLTDGEKEEITQQERLVKETKSSLLQELRNHLPDEVLDWFDTCLALTKDSNDPQSIKSVPAPLLGAGGLDGSMDFGVNYLKRINDIFDPQIGAPRAEATRWLGNALFDDAVNGLISISPQDKKKVSVGQFNPSGAGGSNASQGFAGSPFLNPWDTLLQLEGAVLFSASVVRRLEGSGNIYASLPFTVAPRAVGDAFSVSDESPKGAKRRTAELWLPLWDQPATYAELKGIFKEGRITLHGKPVTDGFNFVRALSELGANRGLTSFHRTAFLKRSGDAFFALDLGRFEVKESPYASLIEELDGKSGFLSKLHRFVRSKTPSGEWRASTALRSLTSRLDASLAQTLTSADRDSVQASLLLLGEIQSALANSKKAVESMPPIPRLSEHWAQMADDGTPAFRIARALAGLKGMADTPLPLRSQLFPVHPRFNNWMEDARKAKGSGNDPACRVRICIGQKGYLPDTLYTLLARRSWLAEQFGMKDRPLDSPAGATLDDIAAFLRSDAMDRRIAELLPGLCLCDIPRDVERSAGHDVVPAAFALLKLCLTPESTLRALHVLGKDDRLPTPPGLLAQLVAGNANNKAVRTAWRRLRASGLNPVFESKALPSLGDVSPRRIAAALLIPLRYGATGALTRSVLHTAKAEAESA